MKKGPDRWRPEPGVLLRAKPYCLVCEASEVDEGWLLEAEEADWFAEALVAGWLAEAVEAGWFVEDGAEGWLAEAVVAGWLAEAEADELLEAEPSIPAICTPAACAWSMAACVFGPLTPSIGPGSKPLSFSACCSCRTDSSPWAWLPLPEAAIEEGWFAEAEADGWFAEAEVDGWFAEAAGWLAEADTAGWLAEADVCLSAGLLSPAKAVPAAINAAARASFLNSMVIFLSSYTERKYTGNRRAVPFGSSCARKFPGARGPSDARCLPAIPRGRAT